MPTSTESFFAEDSLKIKKVIEFVDEKCYFVILHKLVKFHYQTMFASQVI